MQGGRFYGGPDGTRPRYKDRPGACFKIDRRRISKAEGLNHAGFFHGSSGFDASGLGRHPMRDCSIIALVRRSNLGPRDCCRDARCCCCSASVTTMSRKHRGTPGVLPIGHPAYLALWKEARSSFLVPCVSAGRVVHAQRRSQIGRLTVRLVVAPVSLEPSRFAWAENGSGVICCFVGLNPRTASRPVGRLSDVALAVSR